MMPVETNAFMALLSKVLATMPAKSNDETTEVLRKLDGLLRDELPDALNAAGHPNAPELSARCSAFQLAMETAVRSSRFLDKPVVLLEGDVPSRSLTFLSECVTSPVPSVCLKTECDIPIFAVNGNAVGMEAINYSDSAISLDLENEYSMLLTGSRQFNIKLSRIVKCFILTIPLKTTAGTFLLVQKEEAENLFSRFIAMRFLVASSEQFVTSGELKYAGLLCKKPNRDNGHGLSIFTIQTFAQKMKEPMAIPWYGILEEFTWLTSDVINYFAICIRRSEKLIAGLTDDIIHMESSFASSNDDKKTNAAQPKKKSGLDIASLRDREEEFLEEKKSSLHHLKRLICDGKELVDSLLTSIDGEITTPRVMPDAVRTEVFKTFFNAVEADNSEYYNQAMVRLQTLGYTDIPLMKKYIRSKNGSIKDGLSTAEIARQCTNLKPDDWAKAKMLVELTDVENIALEVLEKLMVPLDGHTSSGKELYAKAAIANNSEKHRSYLMASVYKGYAPAGQLLMKHIPETGKDAAVIQMLARHLLPEACIALGETELCKFQEKNSVKKEKKSLPITIDSSCMLYFKLAASQASNEALARIADILFETSFKEVCFITKRPGCQHPALMENAKIICWIADKLIAENFQIAHMREISGIALFCLKDKKFFFESKKRLSSLKQRSAEASYCLGYMSEHGWGCTKHFPSAIKYYKAALKDGPFTANGEYVSKRLAAASQKQARKFADSIDSDSFSDDKDYSGSYHTSSSSRGGGLTMVFLVSLGLAYHSKELEEIRAFRDSVICRTSIGKQLVEEYYRTGPAIRQRIEQSGEAKEICNQLWSQHVQSIQQAILDNKSREAVRGLINMQVELCKRFNIPYNTELVEKFQKRDDVNKKSVYYG